jgi:hypothetical protein
MCQNLDIQFLLFYFIFVKFFPRPFSRFYLAFYCIFSFFIWFFIAHYFFLLFRSCFVTTSSVSIVVVRCGQHRSPPPILIAQVTRHRRTKEQPSDPSGQMTTGSQDFMLTAKIIKIRINC